MNKSAGTLRVHIETLHHITLCNTNTADMNKSAGTLRVHQTLHYITLCTMHDLHDLYVAMMNYHMVLDQSAFRINLRKQRLSVHVLTCT